MSVYIIRAGEHGPCKIGWADDVEARRKQLQVSHHEPLRVLRIIDGARAIERWLHERFAGLRLQGEWFRFHDEMLAVDVPELGPAPPRKPKKERVAQVSPAPELRINTDLPAGFFSMPLHETFGWRMRQRRLELGWTEAELASRLGATPIAVGFWEARPRKPGYANRLRVANALGVPLQTLEGRAE